MSSLYPWWRHAAVYQVYIRSFADGTGDGTGDLAGLRTRLPYLSALGVDAIWVNPWYPSPLNDGGYDVSDYRDIDPRYGSLDEATSFIEEARRRQIIDTAIRTIATRGYSRTSLAEIAREAGISKGVISYHFEGKGEEEATTAADPTAGMEPEQALHFHILRRKKDGGEDPKILPKCTLPLTGVGVVNLIITDLGVLEVGPAGLTVKELAPGVTREQMAAKTAAPVH